MQTCLANSTHCWERSLGLDLDPGTISKGQMPRSARSKGKPGDVEPAGIHLCWIWWTPSKNHLSTWEIMRICSSMQNAHWHSGEVHFSKFAPLCVVTIMILGNHQSIWTPCPFQGVARSLWTSPKCHPRTRSSATSPWAQSHASLHPNLWILACQYRLKRWLETSYLLNCPHHIYIMAMEKQSSFSVK